MIVIVPAGLLPVDMHHGFFPFLSIKKTSYQKEE
jgi:hypothetical protein